MRTFTITSTTYKKGKSTRQKIGILALTVFLTHYKLISQTTINAYAQITSVTGSSILALSNVDITAHTFTVGGQVVVMQMQDDVIGTNTTNASTFGDLSAISNAGRYEIRTISAVTPTTGAPTSLTLSATLANTYNTGTNSSVQLISFRNLGANYTTTANISGLSWNGTIGGVVALNVSNTLTLNHSILANGLGFRGGLYSNDNGGAICTSPSNTIYIANNNQLGFKGESIYKNTNTGFNNARAKMLNGGGGGNDHNGGGGGGGNYTSGGQGGNGYNNCTTFPGGGLGGISLLSSISASRVFLGGGGGGGQQNNSQNSAGANGGGIILIKANTIATSTTCGSSILISASGNTAVTAGNDGMGGGGAGGSIVIQATTFSATATCPLTTISNGGNGGSVTDGAPHGGGGGGGQGVVIYSSAQPTINVTTQTNNGSPGTDSSGGGVSATSGGGTSGTGIITAASGPLPVELISFEAQKEDNRIKLLWKTSSELNNDYFVVERSLDGVNYAQISKVKGAGTKKIASNYYTYDSQPLSGAVYYRLKQVDFDYKYQYSSLISINFQHPFDFIISPNPLTSGEQLNLRFNSNNSESIITISIIDVTGVEVIRHFLSQVNTNDVKLDCTNLNKGMYFVKLSVGETMELKKLLIN
jgi:hypothetical protein